MTTYQIQLDVETQDVFVDAESENDASDFIFQVTGDLPLSIEEAKFIPPSAPILGYGESAFSNYGGDVKWKR